MVNQRIVIALLASALGAFFMLSSSTEAAGHRRNVPQLLARFRRNVPQLTNFRRNVPQLTRFRRADPVDGSTPAPQIPDMVTDPPITDMVTELPVTPPTDDTGTGLQQLVYYYIWDIIIQLPYVNVIIDIVYFIMGYL